MAKFNYKQITEKVASSASGAKRINTIMQRKFGTAQTEMLGQFDSHPVTVEVKEKGELYGFIGFDDDKGDPTEPVKNVLQNDLKLISSRLGRYSSDKKVVYKFSVRVPEEAIKGASAMRWEPGTSWVYAVEKDDGISGFSRFLSALYEKSGSFKKPPSFSRKGLQAKGNTGRGSYKGRPYLSVLIRDMVSRIRAK